MENAKRFEQDVKMEADAYDKQIRQKAQGRIQTQLLRTRTPGPNRSFSTPSSRHRSWWRTTKSPAAPRLTPLKRASAPKEDADSIYNQACVQVDKMLSGAAAALPAPASWRHSETILLTQGNNPQQDR